MAGDKIVAKLRYSEELSSLILDLPEQFKSFFKGGTGDLSGKPDNGFEFCLVFVRNLAEAEEYAKLIAENAAYDALLWVAYPKLSSELRSDVSRDNLWPLLEPYGYKPVSQIALDETWSAMRFRPKNEVKSKR